MTAIPFFRTAQASGDHWGSTVKAALTALGPMPAEANFGLAYCTQPLADDFPSIVTFLRETTPIKQWTIAIAAGLIGPLGTVRARPALALLAAALPAASFRPLEGWQEPRRGQFLRAAKDWLADQPMPVGLAHGDSVDADLPLMIEDLARATHSFLIGGATPHHAAKLSGVLLGAPLTIVTGLTQGCLPLGEAHYVSETNDDIIMSLDGRKALDVLKADVGPALARDLRRAAGIIQIGLPVIGADRADYLVRPLVGIDLTRGWLATGCRINSGDRLLFVKRDGDSATLDMQRMLSDLAQRCDGRRIKGGIYISCVARGEQMFGSDDAEIDMIRRSLGDFPLIGIISDGEVCHDRLYSYTGVLALFLS